MYYRSPRPRPDAVVVSLIDPDLVKWCILLFPLLLTGCFTRKQAVEGTYRFAGTHGVAYEIEIQAGDSFVFTWQNGLDAGVTTGVWKQAQGAVVINGGTPSSPACCRVQEALVPSIDSTYIAVADLEGQGLGLAGLRLNGARDVSTDPSGKIAIRRAEVKTIQVFYLGLDQPAYQVQDPAANHFVMQLAPLQQPSVDFKNTELRLRGNQLRMPGNQLTASTIKLVRQR